MTASSAERASLATGCRIHQACVASTVRRPSAKQQRRYSSPAGGSYRNCGWCGQPALKTAHACKTYCWPRPRRCVPTRGVAATVALPSLLTTAPRLCMLRERQGVHIYVLLYEEVDYFLTMNSAHTEAVLTALHRNIHVIRHRSRFSSNTSWSHHEKAVVVDQRTAFIGGLDLALMRYDDHQHKLDDCEDGQPRTWPGKDYANPRCVPCWWVVAGPLCWPSCASPWPGPQRQGLCGGGNAPGGPHQPQAPPPHAVARRARGAVGPACHRRSHALRTAVGPRPSPASRCARTQAPLWVVMLRVWYRTPARF